MEELDLKELFNIFLEKGLEIILVVAIFIALGFIYSYTMVTPKYTSKTTLLLTQSAKEDVTTKSTSLTESDLKLNSSLVATYSELIKSNAVLREVTGNNTIGDVSAEYIRNNISVKAVADTEIIEIKMSHENPIYAANIANEIANVFSEKIKDIYNIDNVYIVDRAETSTIPSNINHAKDVIIFAIIGFIIACAYVLLVNMFDNTIKTEQDIEKLTGLLVLTSILDCEVEFKKGGKRA